MAERILCVTNVALDTPGGRADALKTRVETLEKHGFKVDFFLIEKPYESFNPLKLHQFKKTVLKEGYKLVWSMNNPFALHIPPLLMKMAGYDFKWIAEFRDPIYLNPDPSKNKVKCIYKRIEKEIINYSDLVVLLRGIQIDEIDLTKEYGKEVLKKTVFLPYVGFTRPIYSYPNQNRFVITYAGSFYENWIEPYTFLEAFSEFVKKERIDPHKIVVRFFGDWNPKYTKYVEKLGISDYVEVFGWVKKDVLTKYFEDTTLFLYIGGALPENRKNVSIKIWDYLKFGKPVLVLADESFLVRSFIRGYKLGYVSSYEYPNDIERTLKKIFEDWHKNKFVKSYRKSVKYISKLKRTTHDIEFVHACISLITGL